jgi:hypothetical protein
MKKLLMVVKAVFEIKGPGLIVEPGILMSEHANSGAVPVELRHSGGSRISAMLILSAIQRF